MSATTGTAVAPPLPELRQDVVITLPTREQFRGRVSRVTDEEIVVVLMMIDTRHPLTLGDASPMVVEFPGPRGLVRLEGRGTVASKDLVRFHHEGAVDIVQRRDFVRVRVVRPLALARIGEDGMSGEWVEGLTVNVSGNGMLASGLAGAEPALAVGDAVAFRATFTEGEPPIAGRGRVARIGDDGQRGIAIEEIDRDARRQLVRFVFEQERIARQRTRDGEL
ncbi:MAG TPA: PilZ domain-containing protein [Conexibacter sp.]|jgi:c-di-GMP-binding flagellar brake protein YcgR|nr:PilZ domain-containing protein [Conexibacter sp.]